ncbi:MAG: DUF5110 domain-containing protein [Verrucomicrobia bacterium]|nr:DUF5110 domain-containing protein [Verrucomicrobiota bacterium]MCH8526028.1 DUF5110 domain-containing protein [Kiritimatiellia bacterium]
MFRVTAFSDALIRLEYHPEGHWDDRPSFFARDRRHGRVLQPGTDGIYRTNAVAVQISGPGPMTAENTQVTFPAGTWRPGQAPTGTLGGTARTLDGTAGYPPVTPGILSEDGWALVDDSGSVRFPDASLNIFPGDPTGQDFYLFLHGHDFRAALRDFIAISGRPPLPPRAVLGMWWSRYWKYSAGDLQTIVGEFRKHDFPLDVLVLDMDWHLAKDWTGYTWNRDLFPDPPAFLAWCHRQGLKTTLNLHPSNGVQAFEADYEGFANALGHPADGTPVPFTCSNPKYMREYFRRLHHPLEAEGVDFWWMDWQQGDVCEMPGLDPLAWLNHVHHVDHDREDRRGVMLSRWGGVGGHRYPIQFSGDTHTRWDTLASQVDFTAESVSSLAGWWSHDIGGHLQPTPPELFTRWVQWGALSPALRLHSSCNPNHERRPWAYGEEVMEACRIGVNLRMRYFPVWIAAAHRFADEGVTPLTPMWFDAPGDAAARAARRQAMLGGDMLIAPFVTPMRDGLAERVIYLPPGDWFDVQTGEKQSGNTFIVVRGDLNRIPVMVREGAVLPIDPRPRRAMADLQPDELHFECWPGNGDGTAVEDAGEGRGWQRGEVVRTRLQQVRTGENLHLRLAPAEGTFPGCPATRTVCVHLRNCARPAGVCGPDALEWHWEEDTLTLTLPGHDSSRAAEFHIRAAENKAGSIGISPEHPVTECVPRYDRHAAQRSLADVVLIPPAKGASATVRWTVQQVRTRTETQEIGPVTAPRVVRCPLAWRPDAGSLRWRVDVIWRGDGIDQTDTDGSQWDLYTGLGEWDVAVLPDPAGIQVEALDPSAPLSDGTPWFRQSHRALRDDSLLDGPRLWCDAAMARRFGLSTGNFTAGTVPDNASAHLAAVSIVQTPEEREVQFNVKALSRQIQLAVDGRRIPLDAEGFTPVLTLSPGRHRIQVLLVDIDVAQAARYFRLLNVIAYTPDRKVLTGLGEPLN